MANVYRKLILVANGMPDYGGPFESAVRYLTTQIKCDFVSIRHPLIKQQDAISEVTHVNRGNVVEIRKIRRLNFPPFTYVIDLFLTPKSNEPRLWITFNSLCALRALMGRSKHKDYVILWSVDFVPIKSSSSIIQSIYKALDKWVHNRVDEHWEVSEAALSARALESGSRAQTSHRVVPMGIWDEAFAEPSLSRFESRKIAYFGSVNKRNGAQKLGDIISLAKSTGANVTFEIVGGGEYLSELRSQVLRSNSTDIVNFHGFVEDPNYAYSILGKSSLAIAPFINDEKSFTAYADPSKFKAYLAASLPTLTSNVPPNAYELEDQAGALVIKADALAQEYLDALLGLLEDFDDWQSRANSAIEYATRFGWTDILKKNLLPLIEIRD